MMDQSLVAPEQVLEGTEQSIQVTQAIDAGQSIQVTQAIDGGQSIQVTQAIDDGQPIQVTQAIDAGQPMEVTHALEGQTIDATAILLPAPDEENKHV